MSVWGGGGEQAEIVMGSPTQDSIFLLGNVTLKLALEVNSFDFLKLFIKEDIH